ncbi:alpha-1,2-fucosyltransferase [Niastella sp. OAS944]|uniref:alpha-1,2-fucosyltransferase n=1 Tax=Niastella sp. OAS944 TaxID=2664089 RepID=UPI00346F5301|nr:hypothetical protein [Chitinophagaceae bacterium OAS944]
MVVVNLKGGLGNQMFQYSFGKGLAMLLNQELFLNTGIYDRGKSNRQYDLDIFKLSSHSIAGGESIYRTLKESDGRIFHVNEKYFHYHGSLMKSLKKYSLVISPSDNVHWLCSGYWQSYKYFEHMESVLRNDFTFCNPIHEKWPNIAEQIEQRNSVMINVRRGDYLNKLDFHGVVDMAYLTKAMDIVYKNVIDPWFCIFSDDMKWCRENFGGLKNIFFVDETYYDPKYQYYLQLMSMCKHFIISNSSFSWWAAWLCQRKNKLVIAPKNWFKDQDINAKDLLPPSWLSV